VTVGICLSRVRGSIGQVSDDRPPQYLRRCLHELHALAALIWIRAGQLRYARDRWRMRRGAWVVRRLGRCEPLPCERCGTLVSVAPEGVAGSFLPGTWETTAGYRHTTRRCESWQAVRRP
jgi:hypothetical protein